MTIFIDSEIGDEKDTLGFKITFKDYDGSGVTPNAGLNWSLTTKSGTIINNRSAVALSPASAVIVTLSGNDLQMFSGEGAAADRYLWLSGTYDSTKLGSGVSINKQIWFPVSNNYSISNT